MADSDDEYDRKRRDKFRGERDSYRPERRDERRPMGGGANSRDEWSERNPFRGSSAAGGGGGGGARHRPDYSDYRGSGPRPRYGSPGREMPPAKRMRPDWGESEMRSNPRFGKFKNNFTPPALYGICAHAGYDPYLVQAWNDHYQSLHSAYSHSSHPSSARESAPNVVNSDTQTQPAMLTLKQFLDTQDENISDSEVMRKYTEYKTDFKRQQLNEFFVAHKDEEWFKNKYHPEDSVRRSEEQRGFLKRRTDVFLELLENGTIGSVKVDSSQADSLVRVLDTCVIKLEGGTDEDLKILDEKPKETPVVYERKSESTEASVVAKREPESPKQTKSEKGADEEQPVVVSPQRKSLRPVNSDEENWDDENDEMAAVPDAAKNEQQTEIVAAKPAKVQGDDDSIKSGSDKKLKKKKIKKRNRNSSDDESSSSSSFESDSDSDDEKLKAKYDVEEGLRADQKAEAQKDKEEAATVAKANPLPPDSPQPEGGTALQDAAAIKSEQSDEQQEKDAEQPAELQADEPAAAKNGEEPEKTEKNEVETKSTADDVTETIDLDKVKDGPQPRALHRTSSIFLRNLAPSITKAEIEAICTRFSGYLRVAIADPLVERRWYRRGWITFTRDVNIKEICWSLNNQRLRDCEMGAIVNRDLSRRVRPANGITAHKQIVRADIKLCAKIAMNLDERFKLWSEADSTQQQPDAESKPSADATNGSGGSSTTYGFNSKNPVLQNITDYLIEEASAEEEELLGLAGDNKDGEGEPIERDEQLISVLDRLVLYLRIVHSVDYYNHCEYPYEDEMPNRCGIIHARGPPPMRVTSNDVQEYIKAYDGKLQQFLTKSVQLSDDEIKELGAKNPETEVEKFVQANTQELAKDKWLCPLSGKKFKGPEFIRKHIFNKHEEKVDEVRKEVQYFNNYLRDPKRPQLPEHPGSSKRTESESGRGSGGYRPPMYPPFSAMPYGFAPPMMGGGGRGGRNFPPVRRPGGFDYRARSHYRDLDAPQEPY
ncbi:serrate RNA effector molecule homolog isoform X2 [Drosophila virilis]|uniref:serrate RNA effector molecule homolog isoform X2 n=1 Tax=Drosophila virilis TaxID=7244 RepID=UPI001396584D|nr:serrate RNA effector molecule homolog isoform X2 [Drosophila virilis]